MARIPDKPPSIWRPVVNGVTGTFSMFGAAFAAAGLSVTPINRTFVIVGAALTIFGFLIGPEGLMSSISNRRIWKRKYRSALERNKRLMVELETRCERQQLDRKTLEMFDE